MDPFETGSNVNDFTNFMGETALHSAVTCNDIKAVSAQIRLGADVNSQNYTGETPLYMAVVNWSHIDVINEIIPNGMLYAKMDFPGLASFGFAVMNRERDALNNANHHLVKMLLDAGADVNAPDNNDCSPLQCAIYTGDFTLVETLVNAGANVNNQNGIGATPLHDAVLCCNDAVVCLLLSRGADVNIRTYNTGDTALHWASILNIDNSHDDIIEKLLESKSNLHVENDCSRSSFNYIVESSDVNMVRFCIDKYKADLKRLASDGSNALVFAVQNLNEKVMDLVLESGIEIDHKCELHRTPLHAACELAMLENVRRLISLGADVNAEDTRGLTPLSQCILGPSKRADISDRSSLVLGRANFEQQRMRVMQLLLENGSDVNQEIFINDPEEDQQSIFEAVIDRREYNVLYLVLEHVAEVEARTNKQLLNEYNLELLDKAYIVKNYYQTCQNELMAMKRTKIEGTMISYFSVLTEPLDVVARYARNEGFVKAYQSDEYQNAYNNYSSKLQQKFHAAIDRQKMLEEASDILSSTLRFADPTDRSIETILKYLSEANICTLIGSSYIQRKN